MQNTTLYKALQSMGQRIATFQDQLPEDWIDRQNDDDIQELILNIEAIEGEWLVTDAERRAFGSFEDEDES